MLDIVKQYTNETLDKVNLNMRHTDWSLNKLLVHIKATNEKIEFLEAYTSKPSLKLLENNSAINYGALKTVSKKEHFIEIAINFNNFMLNKSDIINILNKLLVIIDIDYGYMFYLKEKQNWIFENNFKVSLLSATSKMPDDFHSKREKLLEINNGYFPKVYKYNIFNIEQAKILNKNNLYKINDKLSLYEDEL